MREKNLKGKDYFKIALFYGIVCATLPIIITEITWDSIINLFGLSDISKELIGCFLRAALLEETFKFLGFRLADKKYEFKNEKEYMLGAGVIGLTYGIIEKLVTGNPISIILGILFPFHLLWQMNQGRYYFAYKKNKEKGNDKKAKIELLKATLVIFLLHGCWDALISLISYFIDREGSTTEIIGMTLLLLTIVLGIIYIIYSIKKCRRVLKEYKK